jgi:CRP-like cAMP-binding protein
LTVKGEPTVKVYERIRKSFRKGEIVLSETSACDGMYIIERGSVRIYKTVGTGGAAGEVTLTVLGAGAMFGEMALVDERGRSASVQALEDTLCTVITREIFEDQLSRIPPWMLNVMRILVSRLRNSNETLRQTIARYAAIPDDDTGGLVTLDASEGPGRAARPGAPRRRGGRGSVDEVLNSLFVRS